MIIRFATSGAENIKDRLNLEFLEAPLKACSLEARGRDINRLVDLVNDYILKNRTRVQVKKISIGTEKKIRVRGEKTKNVSWMKITLEKKGNE